MDNSDKEINLKTVEFKQVDDEVHAFDTCGKQLGRIVYFDGNYQYIFWPSKGVFLTLRDMIEITNKIKEISTK